MPSHLWSHLNQRYVLTTDNHRGSWYLSTINHTRRVSLINSLATLAKPLCRGVSRDHFTRVFQLKANVYFFMTQLIYFTTTFIHIEWPQLFQAQFEKDLAFFFFASTTSTNLIIMIRAYFCAHCPGSMAQTDRRDLSKINIFRFAALKLG